MAAILKLWVGFVLVMLFINSSSGAEPLPALGGDLHATSVSGLSSGAYMAVQYQVAFSAETIGAGIVAGGPYYCAAGTGLTFALMCMGKVSGLLPNPAQSYYAAKVFEMAGKIDSLDHLRDARIYIFSGTRDTVVSPAAVNATVAFFRRAGVSDHLLRYDNKIPAGHAFIAPTQGNDCSLNAAPYISHCIVRGVPYDQAGILLRHIYGDLEPPVQQLRTSVVAFDQRAYASKGSGLANTAYIYVPVICRYRNGCRVHVVFHGCRQSAEVMGDRFYTETGYNRWADANRIIVLYPQIAKDTQPEGCWDWIGYTGADYADKNGLQMQAVHRMVERLQEPLLQ